MYTEERKRVLQKRSVEDLRKSVEKQQYAITLYERCAEQAKQRVKFLNELIAEKLLPQKGDIFASAVVSWERLFVVGKSDDLLAAALFKAARPGNTLASTDYVVLDLANQNRVYKSTLSPNIYKKVVQDGPNK